MLLCPRCNVELDPITYKGVTIDKCPKCEGVWLDKGEEAFAMTILAHANKASCSSCAFYKFSDNLCTKLKIYTSREFACSHFLRH